MRIFLFILLSFSTSLCSQEDYFLTPQDKAYLYHTVRKSPILERNIGRYIVYTGPEIILPNGTINYDSTELIIINNPSYLTIYSDEIRKAPKGILAEAANKQAIWELNKTLHAKRQDKLEAEGLSESFKQFEKILYGKLPEVAYKTKNDERYLHPKIWTIFNPSLALNDKIAMLENFNALSLEDKKAILDAGNYAINKWVENRAYTIFTKLGGEADIFINILTAAGDGSSTSGLFEEREKDERGRWNKGLPKAVGLFPYITHIKPSKSNKSKLKLKPLHYSSTIFETAGHGKKTNIHVDVWGYNSEKQTTVVIEKLGKTYPLFGSTESRFLSPDSTFNGQGTYYTLINRVKADIEVSEEKISGRRGYDYWIAYHEDRKKDKLLDIDKIEKELDGIRRNKFTTNEKKYKTRSYRRKRKKRQDKLLDYYAQLSAIKQKIAALKEKKQAVLDVIQRDNLKLNHMLDLIGRKWVPYIEKDGLYIYEDSATFDLYTQEFQFPASKEKVPFEVRLIPIPYSHVSDQLDEVMLHVNMTDAIPNYEAKIQLALIDVFDSDNYKLNTSLFKPSDSIAVMEFFEAMLNNDLELKVIPRASGIGKWNGFKTVKDPDPVTMLSYPGDTKEEQQQEKNDTIFKRLRVSQIEINISRKIELLVNSFTDPVKSNFKTPSKVVSDLEKEYKLSKNEVLSIYRTYQILKTLKEELNILAGDYLSREDAKIVIDRLNKAIDKSSIYVSKYSLKFKEILD